MPTLKGKNGEPNGVSRITLVDDDSTVRRSLKQLFARDERFAVLSEHARAKDALTQLIDMPPDRQPHLVLLDISMPGMDGIECCCELRERFPDLVIAMFTARRLAIYAQAARLAGADAFFCKSLEPRSLLVELAGLHRSSGMLLGPGVPLGGATGDTAMLHDPHLSLRQEHIMELIAQNLTVKEIADQFHVSNAANYKLKHEALARIAAARKP
jgi:DNA-binding NarL/FixJ family response regulator